MTFNPLRTLVTRFFDVPVHDLVCVLLQPSNRSSVPQRKGDIAALAARLSFAGAFRRELRDLALVRQRGARRLWAGRGERRLRRLRLHMIAPPDELETERLHSPADLRLTRLSALRDQGAPVLQRGCSGATDTGDGTSGQPRQSDPPTLPGGVPWPACATS